MSVLESIIDGVALGAVYALVAVGLALVLGVMRLVNFAHGELITAGGYVLALTGGMAAGGQRRAVPWSCRSRSPC